MKTQVGKLNNADYRKFRDFIAEQTGLHFPDKKRADLERGVLAAFFRSGCDSLEDYFTALQKNPNDKEMDVLVNLLTIGETYFYRDEGQFRLLQNNILPKLISERMATTRRLRIWSAGCATGEEPYSVAIILRELIPYIDAWDILILATDINKLSLARADGGRYNQWSFRTMPESWFDKYFFQSASNEFHISEVIKKSVIFDSLNLKMPVFPSSINKTADLDLIIYRNVSIYFDQQTTDEIMDRFHGCLAPGGWLLMGASDPIPPAEKYWARNYSGIFIYQKKTPGHDLRQSERRLKTAKTTKFSNISLTKPSKPKSKKASAPPIDPIAESRLLLEMGQPVSAGDKLAKTLKEHPESIETLLLMAKIEVARGRLQSAGKLVERVIVADKLNISAYYLLSAIHQGLGNEDKAVNCLKKTVYLDKNFISGHFSLGCLYRKHKQVALADKAFNNAIRLMIDRPKDEIVPETNGITYGKLLKVAEKNVTVRE